MSITQQQIAFATNCALLRKRFNLTQEALGEVMLCERTTISNWEKGVSYPSFLDLLKLAAVFRVSLNQLVGPPGQRTPEHSVPCNCGSSAAVCPELLKRLPTKDQGDQLEKAIRSLGDRLREARQENAALKRSLANKNESIRIAKEILG